MNDTLAILNPAAGGGACGRLAPAALARLRDAGLSVDVRETMRPGDATRIARDAFAAGTRKFIAVGGDGTAWEIVNGLFPQALDAAARPRLGYLPLGTGNSFLRDFATDVLPHAHRALVDRQWRRCDVVRARHSGGDMFYTNLLSVGFTADVGATVNRRFKPLGEAGYALGVVSEVARLAARPLPFALDDGPMHRDPLVFASFNNSRFTGGKMMMAPPARTDDGLLDAIVVGAMGRVGLLRTFPRIFDGTHVQHPLVRASTAGRVTFDLSGPVDVMVDGEVVSLHLQSLEVLPGAIEVVA